MKFLVLNSYLASNLNAIFDATLASLNNLLKYSAPYVEREIVLLLEILFIMFYDSLPCDIKMFNSLLPILEQACSRNNDRISYISSLIFMAALNISMEMNKLHPLSSIVYTCIIRRFYSRTTCI